MGPKKEMQSMRESFRTGPLSDREAGYIKYLRTNLPKPATKYKACGNKEGRETTAVATGGQSFLEDLKFGFKKEEKHGAERHLGGQRKSGKVALHL